MDLLSSSLNLIQKEYQEPLHAIPPLQFYPLSYHFLQLVIFCNDLGCALIQLWIRTGGHPRDAHWQMILCRTRKMELKFYMWSLYSIGPILQRVLRLLHFTILFTFHLQMKEDRLSFGLHCNRTSFHLCFELHSLPLAANQLWYLYFL